MKMQRCSVQKHFRGGSYRSLQGRVVAQINACALKVKPERLAGVSCLLFFSNCQPHSTFPLFGGLGRSPTSSSLLSFFFFFFLNVLGWWLGWERFGFYLPPPCYFYLYYHMMEARNTERCLLLTIIFLMIVQSHVTSQLLFPWPLSHSI